MYLSQKGVAFTEKNIRTDPKAMQELMEMGSRGTPTTVIDGEVIMGFERERISKLLGI